MIVANNLSRRSDYRLRFIQTDLHTITFDETVVSYVKDETLFDEAIWNVELKKYKNQLRLNDENRLYYRDNSFDSWVSYTKL